MRPYTIQTREGEAVSPVTSTRTVFDENGVDLDTLLAQQKQDTDNTFKEYAKKTEVAQSLDKKQDKLSTTSELHITSDNIIGLTERGRRAVFDDMYRTAARQYGSIDYTHVEDGVSKPYQLNGLWLTYEEAREALERYGDGVWNLSQYASANIPTNIPPRRLILQGSLNPSQSNSKIRILCGQPNGDLTNGNFHWFLNGCTELEELRYFRFNISSATAWLQGCTKLREIRIDQRVKASFSLEWCPLLSYETFRYMTTEGRYHSNEMANVTVHPDVYAKLTGDTTNAACAALTDAEREQWVALMERAASKNIIFARP